MKKLNPSQLVAIQSLAENQLIKNVQIEFENNLTKVTVISEVGSSFDGVDFVIGLALNDEFPNLEYMGSPAKYQNPVDEINQELYYINGEGEIFIYLIMRLAPEMTPEQIIRDEA